MSPPKVRRVARLIQGMPVPNAEAELNARPERSAEPLGKLLKSAVANAQNLTDSKPETMRVVSVTVTPGPMMKRWRPRSRGMAHPYAKRMSHVTVVLDVPGDKKAVEKAAAPVKLKPGEKIKEKEEVSEEATSTTKGTRQQQKRSTPSRGEVREKKQRISAPRLGRFFRRKSI